MGIAAVCVENLHIILTKEVDESIQEQWTGRRR